jgi:hypothetical protein
MRGITSALTVKQRTKCDVFCIWIPYSGLNSEFEDLFEPINGLKIYKEKIFGNIASSFRPKIYRGIPVKIRNKFYHNLDLVINNHDFNNYFIPNEIKMFDFIKRYKNVYIETCHEFDRNGINFFKEFIPVKAIQDKINAIVSSFTSESVIGVHIRRGDHKKAMQNSPVSLFYEAIEKEISKNEKVKFFLATDDVEIEKSLKEKYPKKIIVSVKVLDRNSKQGIQDAVVDMFCLANTQKIYGSYWSSYSETAAKIYNKELIILQDNR